MAFRNYQYCNTAVYHMKHLRVIWGSFLYDWITQQSHKKKSTQFEVISLAADITEMLIFIFYPHKFILMEIPHRISGPFCQAHSILPLVEYCRSVWLRCLVQPPLPRPYPQSVYTCCLQACASLASHPNTELRSLHTAFVPEHVAV
jgi:hypothetical protein